MERVILETGTFVAIRLAMLNLDRGGILDRLNLKSSDLGLLESCWEGYRGHRWTLALGISGELTSLPLSLRSEDG
jgi:hypothetical protein